LRDIRSIQPHGPYHLLGWSFGGLVAHTIACRLQREGESVALVGIIDAYPYTPEAPLLRDGPDDEGSQEQEVFRLVRDDIKENPPAGMTSREAGRMVDLMNYVGTLEADFPCNVFVGDVLLFAASRSAYLAPLWHPFVSGTICINELPGSHYDMVRPAVLSMIGQRIEQSLAVDTERRVTRS